ncbi:MAG: hypothetical protein IPN94_13175 [Sphingobacteriales bacterium]|nr:hypothetical protein [Sphingobacteriales bacterium]
MLHAHGNLCCLPMSPAQSVFQLRGRQLSTSLSHAVWLLSYLNDFRTWKMCCVTHRHNAEQKTTILAGKTYKRATITAD